MRVVMCFGPERFLTRADPLLKSDPFSTSVITTTTARIAAGAIPNSDENLWNTIEGDDGRVIGVAMHTPPHHMFLSRMPRDAVVALAHEVADRGRDLPGINGAIESTTAFAKVWEEITGHSSRVRTAMRMYRLVDLVWPEAVRGGTHRAELPDLSVVAEWLAAFHNEAQPDAPVDDWHAMAQRRIEAGEVHLWHAEGVPVALAALSGAPTGGAPTGVARIGPVYTPPVWRRHGYGAMVTAVATAAALAAGADHVVLYTDLANQTSNAIYKAIGYRPDHDAEERIFS
jgi:RimJ/RimL family protein N-acetyltransferase